MFRVKYCRITTTTATIMLLIIFNMIIKIYLGILNNTMSQLLKVIEKGERKR